MQQQHLFDPGLLVAHFHIHVWRDRGGQFWKVRVLSRGPLQDHNIAAEHYFNNDGHAGTDVSNLILEEAMDLVSAF